MIAPFTISAGWRSLPCIAGFLATVVALGACDHPRLPDAIHPEVTDHTRRHPIVVAPQMESIDIAVGPGGAAQDHAYIEATRFLRQYKRGTTGPLFVSLPADNRGAASAIRTAIEREGVPADRIKWQYVSAPGIVTLSYDRIAAIPPVCGNWQEDVTRNPERVPYPDWGCSTQHNIAVMAANPTDTIFPAREVPRIGAERPGAPKQGPGSAGGANGAGAAAPSASGSPSPAGSGASN